jgi:hypothetical protein
VVVVMVVVVVHQLFLFIWFSTPQSCMVVHLPTWLVSSKRQHRQHNNMAKLLLSISSFINRLFKSLPQLEGVGGLCGVVAVGEGEEEEEEEVVVVAGSSKRKKRKKRKRKAQEKEQGGEACVTQASIHATGVAILKYSLRRGIERGRVAQWK